MAGFPEGITTALVHLDAPISFIGQIGRIHATITSNVPLVWAATGTPIGNFIDNVSLDPGVPLELRLPHTDQAGFLDESGQTITGWYYRIEVTYELDGQTIPFPARDFQIVGAQDNVDLALIPGGQAAEPVTAPQASVVDIGGFTGSVTLEELQLHLVDNTRDLDKPVSKATQAALNKKADISAVATDLSAVAAELAKKAPLASPTFTGTVGGITKAMVGLSNADNTSDANKPVSTAQKAALDLKAPLASPTFTGTVGGVTKTHVGLGSVDNTADTAKPVSAAQQAALDLKAPLASPTFTGTVGGVTKTHVGLGNADNTSDANKPVSTAQKAALDLKADKTAVSNVNNTSDANKPVSTAQKTYIDAVGSRVTELETGPTSLVYSVVSGGDSRIIDTELLISQIPSVTFQANHVYAIFVGVKNFGTGPDQAADIFIKMGAVGSSGVRDADAKLGAATVWTYKLANYGASDAMIFSYIAPATVTRRVYMSGIRVVGAGTVVIYNGASLIIKDMGTLAT